MIKAKRLEKKLIRRHNPRRNQISDNHSPSLVQMFDERRFCKHVIEKSKELFISNANGSIRSSVLEAWKGYRDYVRTSSGLSEDGFTLMSNAFTIGNEGKIKEPKIKINGLRTITERDEQRGVMYLSMGVATAIRNFVEHGTQDTDLIAENALAMLSVISYVWQTVKDNSNKLKIEKFLKSESYIEANSNCEGMTELFQTLSLGSSVTIISEKFVFLMVEKLLCFR